MGFSRYIGLAAFAVVAVAAPVAGQAQPADFAARADAIVAASYPADQPGAAVIVTRGGRTIYARGRGLADLESGRAITPDTVFRLGSITKQFTAAIVLQLVSEGKISLDDPVSRFFPDFPQPGATATVRQLLNHTSGIQSYTAIPGWMMSEANTGRPHTTAEMIALFRDLPAPGRPGEAWAYNNSGYVLLGAIIEQVTGRPWHQEVERRIVRPLGLATIAYGVDRETGPAMARGYTASEDGAAPARALHMSVPHAAGALIGTVGDLARWANALHHGRVVPPALYAQMISPTPLPGGNSHPYGFGLGTTDIRGRPAVGHSGGIFGFSTDSVYVPSEDVFVAVFANSDEPATGPGLVVRRLAAAAIGDPFEEFTAVPLEPAQVEPLLGVYQVEGAPGRRFFMRDGKLFTQRDDGLELEAFPAGNDRFFYGPNSLTWFRLVRQADGAHVMEMHQNGERTAERAVRTGPVPPEAPPVAVDRSVLESYVGDYTTPGPVATVALTEAGHLTIQLSGQPAIGMRSISATEFRVEQVNARVVFHSEGGQVTGLTIHQGGQQLPGRRTGR
jgi:CubicO group peptidase (beta-lactamase class C family)